MSNTASKGLVVLEDDFLGKTLLTTFEGLSENSGTAAINDSTENGLVALVTGASSGNRSSIVSRKNWKASDAGPLEIVAYIAQTTAITARSVFVGFTDLQTIIQPFSVSGTTVTSNNTATGVGVVYDSNATALTYQGVGCKATAVTALVNTGITPALASGSFDEIRVTLDGNGNAIFTVNGVQYGITATAPAGLANAFTAGTLMTPIVCLTTNAAAAKTMQVDYIKVSGGRL